MTIYNGPERRDPSLHELDKEVALLKQSNEIIREELRAINGNISKLVWIVVGAVIVGLINLWVRFGASQPVGL